MLFQERGAYNILLWFCFMCHPLSAWPWLQIHCPLAQSCRAPLYFDPLHYGANPRRDAEHLRLPATSMGVESAQHLAESGPFCSVVNCCSQSARKDLLRSCGLVLSLFGMCLQLSPEEEEKRRIRRERNKLAAAKCRNRRRELTEKLQAVCTLHASLPFWFYTPRITLNHASPPAGG